MLVKVRVSGSRMPALGWALAGIVCAASGISSAQGQELPSRAVAERTFKARPITDFLSSGGHAALFGRSVPKPRDVDAPVAPEPSAGTMETEIEGYNEFVNDPCVDPHVSEPFPHNLFRTMQSESEIAVLNRPDTFGKMVVGYNDSFGFDNNREGVSGFAYSYNGGSLWIDGGGLPPLFPSGISAPPPGKVRDQYFGDPVVVVHHRTQKFYYSSLYSSSNGYFTVSVNRGQFLAAPPQNVESRSSIRCLGHPEKYGTRLPPSSVPERIIWEPPVEAVKPPFLGPFNGDFLDKPWLHVDQKTGTLYLTYTRLALNGETPLELVVSFDQGQTWTAPRVIVPNLADTFNQATMPTTTHTGRLIVTWFARQFDLQTGQEVSQRIEAAFSDDDGLTFSAPVTVAEVNPQGEPNGYNRGRSTILNQPFIAVDRGRDDGVDMPAEMSRPGFGNVYITYFDGASPFGSPDLLKAADIHLSTSTDNGVSWGPEVLVNDDGTLTTHVFPTAQVNKNGKLFVAWLDRRRDPGNNILTRAYAAASTDRGANFGLNKQISNAATSWFVRSDGAPNFGDYNSSELISFNTFVTTWADARFRPPRGAASTSPPPSATPDVIFTKVTGPGFEP